MDEGCGVTVAGWRGIGSGVVQCMGSSQSVSSKQNGGRGFVFSIGFMSAGFVSSIHHPWSVEGSAGALGSQEAFCSSGKRFLVSHLIVNAAILLNMKTFVFHHFSWS